MKKKEPTKDYYHDSNANRIPKPHRPSHRQIRGAFCWVCGSGRRVRKISYRAQAKLCYLKFLLMDASVLAVQQGLTLAPYEHWMESRGPSYHRDREREREREYDLMMMMMMIVFLRGLLWHQIIHEIWYPIKRRNQSKKQNKTKQNKKKKQTKKQKHKNKTKQNKTCRAMLFHSILFFFFQEIFYLIEHKFH